MNDMMTLMNHNIYWMIYIASHDFTKRFGGTRVYMASKICLNIRLIYLCGMLRSRRGIELKMIDSSQIHAGVKSKCWGKIKLTVSMEFFNRIFICA